MPTESFYTTAAQVFPTLLVALSVELFLLMQVRVRKWTAARDEWEKENKKTRKPRPPQADDAPLVWIWTYIGLAAVFVTGEITAFLAIGANWYNAGTFCVVGVSLLIMVVGVAVVPIGRFDATLPW